VTAIPNGAPGRRRATVPRAAPPRGVAWSSRHLRSSAGGGVPAPCSAGDVGKAGRSRGHPPGSVLWAPAPADDPSPRRARATARRIRPGSPRHLRRRCFSAFHSMAGEGTPNSGIAPRGADNRPHRPEDRRVGADRDGNRDDDDRREPLLLQARLNAKATSRLHPWPARGTLSNTRRSRCADPGAGVLRTPPAGLPARPPAARAGAPCAAGAQGVGEVAGSVASAQTCVRIMTTMYDK